jgi:hypothetical protein
MIAGNPGGEGKALKLYRRFWGLRRPPQVQKFEAPGFSGGSTTLVGLGWVPELGIASRRGGHVRRIKGGRKWRLATDAGGRRLWVFRGRSMRARRPQLKFVGYVAETHYIPTGPEERAGSFKRGRHWVHKHHEGGGKWPKLYQDQAGNLWYGKGTYRVGKWIRR